jgi:hypothetical protein
MARRRQKEGVGISLVPILSIQKCAMGLMVVIICAQTAVSIAKTADEYLPLQDDTYLPRRQQFVIVKTTDTYLEISGSAVGREAVYVECQDTGILIHPEKTKVSLESLKGQGPSAFRQLLNDLQAARDKKYLVLLIRPEGIGAYQRCFDLARQLNLDVGKDVLPSGGTLVLTKGGQPVPGAAKEVR